MHINRHNKSGSISADVKLPPISANSTALKANGECGINEEPNSNVAASNSVAPPSRGMVSQNPRGTSSKNLIYRSIPPKPHTFTLSDMLEPNFTHQMGAPHNKKLGLTGSSSSEFAKRFMSRPTTQPKVVEFNVKKMGAQKRRGINGFFPPVKLRGSAKADKSVPTVAFSEPPPPPSEPSPLQLVPTAYSEVRPKSESRSISRSSRHSHRSIRKTPESVRTAPPQENMTIYPETFEFDDLSYLPRPKKYLPKRDLPWVFRYKVKRNMNELSKIMASKPGPLIDV
ncbi:uncharacterized protein LOC128555048 [Mercenaria mercenaria]|uniref:uncharacterized protein LOC128555048 n=1 Tax=Mercenaria mercenaria TaxID=6596 RepID=UPI00234E9896|nr:uncharacterized protein LOC128555048 [Mercenaria mercenaria]